MQKQLYIERVLPSIPRGERNQRMNDGEKIPVVLCRADEIHFSFWCPYCLKFHLHGVGENGDALGHRVAHCHEDKSPFTRTGYFLVLDREWQKIDTEWLAAERERIEARKRKVAGGGR